MIISIWVLISGKVQQFRKREIQVEEVDEPLYGRKKHSDENMLWRNSEIVIRRWKTLTLTEAEMGKKDMLRHGKGASGEKNLWE